MADITPKESNMFLGLAGLWGAVGVIMLAAGGHPPQTGILTTGGQFLLFHAPAVMVTTLQTRFGGIYKRAALVLMLVGSGMFALEIGLHVAYGSAVAGPLAPIGGVCAILGWLCIAIGAVRGDYREPPRQG